MRIYSKIYSIKSDREHFIVLNEMLAYRSNWVKETHPAIWNVLNQVEMVPNYRYDRQNGYQYTDIHQSKYPCENRHQLALEQPRVPDDGDTQRVAYWQTDEKQAKDLATVTSLGKYLKRHFPTMPDNVIRDMVALQAPIKYEIWDTTEGIIKAAQEGPSSCMQWSDEELNDNDGRHPYEAYDPKYGWKVCVGLRGNLIQSRALLNGNVFVRAYGRSESGGTSTDDAMVAYLKSQGYKYRNSGWPEGTKLAKIRNRASSYEWLLPYLDGCSENAHVSFCGDCFMVDSSGEFECRNTDGGYEERELNYCDHCEERVTGEVTPVGYDGDGGCVCDSCIHDYTYVRGQDRRSYYVPDDEAIYVGNRAYHEEYASDNGIVQLHDGEYVNEDDTVYVQNEDYYSVDDIGDNPNRQDWTVCREASTDDYYLRSDCEYCIHNEAWYLSELMTELANGEFVLTTDMHEFLCDTLPEQLETYVDAETAQRIMNCDDYAYQEQVATMKQLTLALDQLKAIEEPVLEGV